MVSATPSKNHGISTCRGCSGFYLAVNKRIRDKALYIFIKYTFNLIKLFKSMFFSNHAGEIIIE